MSLAVSYSGFGRNRLVDPCGMSHDLIKLRILFGNM